MCERECAVGARRVSEHLKRKAGAAPLTPLAGDTVQMLHALTGTKHTRSASWAAHELCLHRRPGLCTPGREQRRLQNRKTRMRSHTPELFMHGRHDLNMFGKEEQPTGILVQAMQHIGGGAAQVAKRTVDHAAALPPVGGRRDSMCRCECARVCI